MTTMIRTWLGLAALGAGLVHLAVAAGAAPLQAALLVLIGAAEVVWGVTALARETVPVPRVALAGAALTVVAWVAVLLLGAGSMAHMAGMGDTSTAGSGLPALSMLGAAVLDLACAAALAVVIRRGRPRTTKQPGVWSYLGGVVAGAAIVAGITSASLGGTPVGALAMQGMHMGH